MFMLIAVLVPSLVGVKILDYLEKGISLKNGIYYFAILLLFSSVIDNILTYLLFNINSDILTYLNTLPIFFCKYILISVVINVLLAIIIFIIKSNVIFEIEVEKNEKIPKRKFAKKKNN